MRPRGSPSMTFFLSSVGPPDCAVLPTAATSAVSASSAVVHGLVADVPPPPPVLPPLLLPPLLPPPQAATTTDMATETKSARVRVINKKPRNRQAIPGSNVTTVGQ